MAGLFPAVEPDADARPTAIFSEAGMKRLMDVSDDAGLSF